MRRDELMKPDIFSELLLAGLGSAMALFLLMTLWLSFFHG
jgi:hypothetical protein